MTRPDDDGPMQTVEPKRPYFKYQQDGSIKGFWVRPTDAIHHIDGNPYNNEFSNLRVVSLRDRRTK